MDAWIYLYSKFTEEAGAILALSFCVLLATYSFFWVLKKRRLGVARDAVPSNLVKVYLNELISEAHLVQGQLFGLSGETQAPSAAQLEKLLSDRVAGMGMQGPTLNPGAPSQQPQVHTQAAAQTGAASTGVAANPQEIAALKAKIAEQEKIVETLALEKTKLEQSAQTAQSGGSASAGNSNETLELKKQVKVLEEKLAEYNVIEDDLANLKRLQQENAKLRAQLGLPVEEPKLTAPVAAPPKAEAAPKAAVATPTPAAFEKVVDKIETDLAAPKPAPQATATAVPVTPASPSAPTPGASADPAAAAAPAAPPKSDEDLLSEFEKMLGG